MRVDRDFLERFLVDHLPRLRAFVRLRMPAELRRREGESDVLQVACMQVLQHGSEIEFRSDGALVHWLFGAVENAVRSMLRSHRAARRSPDRETSDGDRKLLESYATLCTPSRILAAREEVARIEAAMDTLSPTQRDVLMLHFFVGLDHVAIAEQCDLSAVAVRTHLHRGIARLTAEIDRRRGPAA